MRKTLVFIVPAVLVSLFSITSLSAPSDRVEQLLDVLVTANFNDDFVGAGQALTAVVEFERASGIEPSGRMAVIQVREAAAFAEKLDRRVQGYIDTGFPILAKLELARFVDILRFEPSGAARARAISDKVDTAGAALCDAMVAEAEGKPATRLIADGVCGAFGRLQAGPVTTRTAVRDLRGLVVAPVGSIGFSGDVRGFVDTPSLVGAVDRNISSSPLVGQGGSLALAVVLSGTSVSTAGGAAGKFPFEYAIEVPYAEMEEYCEWVEEVKLETVVEGKVTKTVRRTTRTCNKSQRPVDKVRVEPRTVMLDGTEWKQTHIWQYKVAFDDGDGCRASRTFDGRTVYADIEHNLSDPAIGLAPDPKSLPTPTDVATELAAQIGSWIVGTESSCLRQRWCGAADASPDLESVLRCAALPGSDPRAVDSAIGGRFGLSMSELLRFINPGN